MALSSAIGFFKIIVLARLLGASEFGHYVALYGVALFIANLVSLGSVEETIKQYPRLWSQSRFTAIAFQFRRVSKMISVRYLILVLVLMIIINTPFWRLEYTSQEVLSVFVVAWATTIVLIYASIIRASDSLRYQKLFYFAKSMFSFVPAVLLGYTLGWSGAIFGEVIGAVLFLIYSANICERFGVRVFSHTNEKMEENLHLSDKPGGGKRLYFGFILTSGVIQLDKMLVNLFVGAAQAGTYGVVSIVHQASSVLVNIVTQRVGTRFIKLNFNNVMFARQLLELLLWVGGFVVFVAVGVSLLLLFKSMGLADTFVQKYGISDQLLVLTGLIAILQVYAMMDFFLIAHDSESVVLWASLFGFVIFATSFCIGYWLAAPVEWYLKSILVSKLGQVGIQSAFVLRKVLGR